VAVKKKPVSTKKPAAAKKVSKPVKKPAAKAAAKPKKPAPVPKKPVKKSASKPVAKPVKKEPAKAVKKEAVKAKPAAKGKASLAPKPKAAAAPKVVPVKKPEVKAVLTKESIKNLKKDAVQNNKRPGLIGAKSRIINEGKKVVEVEVKKEYKKPILAGAGTTIVPPDYSPTKDKGEFMNPVMAEYFRIKLMQWRAELVRESSETIHNTLQSTELQKPDLADRASAETDHALELRTRDRERKLISKINEALLRIDDGEYGFCEDTGEPISVARLDARPIATLSLEAQERHERLERTHRDD